MSVRLLLVLVVGAWLSAAEASDPTTTVRAELERLNPPWYETERDDWQRIAIREPEAPAERHYDNLGLMTGIMAWLLVALVVIGLVLLLVFLVRDVRFAATLTDEPQGPPPRLRAADLSTLPFHVDVGADPAAEAEAAFARGDWTRTVVWTYVLLLLRLDNAGLIRLGPGATDQGCVRQAREAVSNGRPARAAAALELTVGIFERAYFGHRPATREEAVAVRSRYAGVNRELDQEERT